VGCCSGISARWAVMRDFHVSFPHPACSKKAGPKKFRPKKEKQLMWGIPLGKLCQRNTLPYIAMKGAWE